MSFMLKIMTTLCVLCSILHIEEQIVEITTYLVTSSRHLYNGGCAVGRCILRGSPRRLRLTFTGIRVVCTDPAITTSPDAPVAL